MTQEEQILDTVIDIVRSELKKFEPLVCVGEVTHVNPLNIKVGSYSIDEDFMVIDSSCRKTVINIPTDEEYEHTHSMADALVNHTAIGNMGAPVVFVPQGIEPFVPNPNFDPSQERTDDDTNKGTGTNPYWIINPAIPNPTTLTLKHSHGIHNALPKILVHRGLKVGDKVNVLRIGSVHIIRGRVGMLTNDGSLDDDGSEQL